MSSLTVWTGDHDRTMEDGKVSHAVCSKTEHPSYNKTIEYDNDIAILKLCKPLMFTEGKLSKYQLSKAKSDTFCNFSGAANMSPELHQRGLRQRECRGDWLGDTELRRFPVSHLTEGNGEDYQYRAVPGELWRK